MQELKNQPIPPDLAGKMDDMDCRPGNGKTGIIVDPAILKMLGVPVPEEKTSSKG